MSNSVQNFEKYAETFLPGEKRYFAAANTHSGFVSFFPKIFSARKLKHIYMLKGGPGCGKSTLLKRLALYCEKQNVNVEYFHCSSSPFSLDAILIPEKGAAVIDATSPHTLEPMYPGVCETIVDMGKCWDTKMLEGLGQRIINLSDMKSALYKKAYRYLSAMWQVREEMLATVWDSVLYEKMQKCADRLCVREKLKASGKRNIEERFTSAISCSGSVRLSTFENLSDKKYFIKDSYGIAHIFLRLLFESSGCDAVISRDPLDPEKLDGIYFPKSSLCVVLSRADTSDGHTVNTERFVDKEAFSKNRQKYRFSKKCAEALFAGASEVLFDAGRLHEKIENEYAKAADYFVADRIYSELRSKLFG